MADADSGLWGRSLPIFEVYGGGKEFSSSNMKGSVSYFFRSAIPLLFLLGVDNWVLYIRVEKTLLEYLHHSAMTQS